MKFINTLLLPLAALSLLLIQSVPANADLVVAADGSGHYTTIQSAIAAAPSGTAAQPTVIDIKPGTYRELIYAQREKHFIVLKGDDPDPQKTVVTFGLYAGIIGPDGLPIGTFRTPTAYIDADDFVVENVDFVNSAGNVGQALAIRVDGDRDVFKNCRFDGYQDTILDNRGRHYYDRCTVTGAVDFIFGGGCGVFDHSKIVMIRPDGGKLTAPSTPQDQDYGLVFLSCTLPQGPGILDGKSSLMRPWRPYGESAFINCTMGSHISAAGFEPWDGRELTSRAYEYGSVMPDGKPVDVSKRLSWSHQLTKKAADRYTLSNIFVDWDPKHAEAAADATVGGSDLLEKKL